MRRFTFLRNRAKENKIPDLRFLLGRLPGTEQLQTSKSNDLLTYLLWRMTSGGSSGVQTRVGIKSIQETWSGAGWGLAHVKRGSRSVFGVTGWKAQRNEKFTRRVKHVSSKILLARKNQIMKDNLDCCTEALSPQKIRQQIKLQRLKRKILLYVQITLRILCRFFDIISTGHQKTDQHYILPLFSGSLPSN